MDAKLICQTVGVALSSETPKTLLKCQCQYYGFSMMEVNVSLGYE
jgi:hypothetical protein